MDTLIDILKVTFYILIFVILNYFLFRSLIKFRVFGIKKKIKENDKFVKAYFKAYKDNKMSVLDDTPLPVYIGSRIYILKPLSYRQFTRLCIMYAHLIEKLSKMNIDIKEADKNLGAIIEACEDDFFRILAVVLFLSKNETDDLTRIKEGMDYEFEYLKNNASMDDLTRILQILYIQNDIESSIASFGAIFNVKKKVENKAM